MNQLFYNIANGTVHQIQRKKWTTISEVIVRGKRNIKQIRNWFISSFLLKVLFYCSLNTKFLILKNKLRSRMTPLLNNYFLIKYTILLTTENVRFYCLISTRHIFIVSEFCEKTYSLQKGQTKSQKSKCFTKYIDYRK